MISADQVLKVDKRGRVHTPASRQEELLDEFERSGLSGAKFAEVSGIKYQTFAAWVSRRRKMRQSSVAKPSEGKADPVRWLEAVVDRAVPGSGVLVIHLPGGARMDVADGQQATLAAELLRLLEKGQPAPC